MFAGPGAGKSTLAAGLFYKCKQNNINCELVTEYAKELTWEHNCKTLAYQPKLLGEQAWRIERLRGKVDLVITDSPILLSSIYAGSHFPKSFHEFCLWQYKQFNNYNIYIQRTKPYIEIGRGQTYKQAVDIDNKIKILLILNDIEFCTVQSDDVAVDTIYESVRSFNV